MLIAVLNGLNQGVSNASKNKNRTRRKINGKTILFVAGAVPDALSVSGAREIVGQPHLSDHDLHAELLKLHGGPVHVIACHKTVTEAQARTMLGFPDATVVSAPFGIYVVDPVQSIQLVLLAQCRDPTSTQHAVQKFLEWLDESNKQRPSCATLQSVRPSSEHWQASRRHGISHHREGRR